MVAGKKPVRLREGLLVIFLKLETQVWLKMERMSKREGKEGVGNKCTGGS